MKELYRSLAVPPPQGKGNVKNTFGDAVPEDVRQAGTFGKLVKGFKKTDAGHKGYAPSASHKGILEKHYEVAKPTSVAAHNSTGHSTNLKGFSPKNQGQAGKIGSLIGYGKSKTKK